VAEGFVPFALYLRAVPKQPAPAKPQTTPPQQDEPAHEGDVERSVSGLAQDVALLRAAAAEAFERRAARLLRALADDVLARELELAAPACERLVQRALAELRELEPLGLRMAPSEADRFRGALPVAADATLAPGDAVVELRDGALESPLRFRLAAVLARALDEDGA
jgi:flagellar biosynthesis/type III secretory pathway protein FliH